MVEPGRNMAEQAVRASSFIVTPFEEGRGETNGPVSGAMPPNLNCFGRGIGCARMD